MSTETQNHDEWSGIENYRLWRKEYDDHMATQYENYRADHKAIQAADIAIGRAQMLCEIAEKETPRSKPTPLGDYVCPF